jgi:hypothetical protein
MTAWLSLVVRRAVTQFSLLAAVLAVVVLGATLLGTGSLLLTSGQRDALDATLAGAGSEAVDVVASFRVSGIDTAEVVAEAHQVVADGLAPARPALSTWITSDVRRLSLPSTPYAYLTGAEGFADARLLDGRWPDAAAGVVEVAIPEIAADRLDLDLGAEVVLEELQDGILDRDGAGPEPMTLRVVGVYAPVTGPDGTWVRDLLTGSGFTDHWELAAARELTQVAAYGPFLVARDAMLAEFAADRVSVHARPGVTGLSPAERADVRRATATMADRLRATLGERARSPRVTSDLAQTIGSAETQARVTGSAILAVALLGMAIAAAALALAGRLVVARRAGETDLLASRGARRGQLATQATVEAGCLALVAAMLAVPLSAALYGWVVARLHMTDSPDAGVRPALVVAVAASALLLSVALVLPAWRAADRRPPGRRSVRAGVGRVSVDLLLVAGAAVGYLQLRGQRFSGTGGPDPILVAAPLLMLLAGTALGIRLLPWLSGRAERRALRSRRLVVPLASWEVARRPHSTGAAFLLILATAAGTFGLALGATWSASTRDQADSKVGTDLAVTRTEASIVTQADALVDTTGGVAVPVIDRAVVLRGASGDALPGAWLVAPDTTLGAELMRGRLPSGHTWAQLTSGLAPTEETCGIGLPADARHLLLSVRGSTGATPLQVVPTVTVQTPGGARDTLVGPTVPLDGEPHDVDILLRDHLGVAAGLEVVAMSLRISLDPLVDPWVLPRGETVRMVATLGITTDGDSEPTTSGDARWSAAPAPAAQSLITLPEVSLGTVADGGPADLDGGFNALVTVAATVRTPMLVAGPADLALTAFEPPRELPVLVAASLAQAIAAQPGDLFGVDIGGLTLTGRVVAVAPAGVALPHDAVLLADYDAVTRLALAQGHIAALADTWWMAQVTDPASAAQAISEAGIGAPSERAAVGDALARAPLRVGLQASLWILVAAACLLALAGTTVQAAAALEARATDFARLRGMGVPRHSVILALLLEHSLVSLMAVGVGGLAGAVTSWLVGPLLVVSPTGAPPVPAARPQWLWSDQVPLLGGLLLGCAVVVVPVAVRLIRRAARFQDAAT